jgi:hypothetical protein
MIVRTFVWGNLAGDVTQSWTAEEDTFLVGMFGDTGALVSFNPSIVYTDFLNPQLTTQLDGLYLYFSGGALSSAMPNFAFPISAGRQIFVSPQPNSDNCFIQLFLDDFKPFS